MRGLVLAVLVLSSGCVSSGRYRADLSKAHEQGFVSAVNQMKPYLDEAKRLLLEVQGDNDALRDVNAQLAAKCAKGKAPEPRACKAKGLGK